MGLAAGLALIGLFVAWELRQEHPLLNPRIFRQRSLSAGSMSIFIQFFAFFGFTFIALQYLQLVRGDTPLLAAVQVLPMAATMMPTSRLAPKLVARFGTRRVCSIGLMLVAVGLAVISRLTTDSSYAVMAAGLLVLGVGMGAAMTPATSAITEGLPSSEQGVGSAINDLSREVGGAIGIAVIGSILSAVYSSSVKLGGLPPTVAAKVKDSYAIASTLPAPIPARAHEAFVSAMHVALLSAAGAALLAAVGVAVLLGRRATDDAYAPSAPGSPGTSTACSSQTRRAGRSRAPARGSTPARRRRRRRRGGRAAS